MTIHWPGAVAIASRGEATYQASVGNQQAQASVIVNAVGPKSAARKVWRYYVKHGSWWPKGVRVRNEKTKETHWFLFRMTVGGDPAVIPVTRDRYVKALRM